MVHSLLQLDKIRNYEITSIFLLDISFYNELFHFAETSMPVINTNFVPKGYYVFW